MNQPTHIIIHHSASPDEERLDEATIRDWHVLGNGWKDIAYHYVVEYIDGHAVTIVGRPAEMAGAHCPGFNERSIAICIVMDAEKDDVPRPKWLETGRMTRSLQRQYGIPRGNVLGHREAMPGHTVCPGRNMDMERFRQEQCLP